MKEDRLKIIQISGMANKNGPGLRTMIHLKGCPLKCVWCSTPESQSKDLELLVNSARCIGCGKCIAMCKNRARVGTENHIVSHDWSKCMTDFHCTKVCSSKALEVAGKDYSPEELLKIVMREKIMYVHSGGGVTISGGEPLMQVNQAFIRFLALLSENNISVGIDTTGYVEWEILQKVVPFTEFFLWDFKQIDTEKHREYTGVGNEKILNNLYKLDSIGKDIYLRCPMIPGFTDDDANIAGIIRTARSLNSLREVHLIPLHHYGIKRYEMIGKKYYLNPDLHMEIERLNKIKQELNTYAIACKIM